MSFGQVFVVRPIALDEVGHGIESKAVDAHLEPEPHDRQNFLENTRIVEIQVRLMRIKAVPIISVRDRVPSPVRSLGVEKDDARAGIFLASVRPNIKVRAAASRAGERARAETRDAGPRCD